MTVPVAWREEGHDGRMQARIITSSELGGTVVADGEREANVTATGVTAAVVVNQSENVMVGGGGT